MVRTGELPPKPSAHRIRTALGIGMDAARAVRDRLNTGGASWASTWASGPIDGHAL